MDKVYIKNAITRAIKTGAQVAASILTGNGVTLFSVSGHEALILIGGSTLASILMSVYDYPNMPATVQSVDPAFLAGIEAATKK